MFDSTDKYRRERPFDNFYCYIWQGKGNNCNTYIFTDILSGDKPHIIVDPGIIISDSGEQCFESLVEHIEKDGLRIEDIGLIINTHCHADHCQSNELIVQKSNADVTISEEEENFRHTIGRKLDSMFGTKSPEFTPRFYMKEGDLNLGDNNELKLQVIITPGHSPGSVCLYWPEHKALITGDVVYCGCVGRTDFPGRSRTELKKSIHRLSQLDVEYLFPGHKTEFGCIINGKTNIKRNFHSVKMSF
jgi:hydroxyacylglutathione hydrolase